MSGQHSSNNEKTQEFWTKDPTVLFNKEYISQLWPKAGMTTEEKLNVISRLVIILTFLGYLITMSYNIFIIGLITLGIVAFLYNYQNKKETIETKYKTKEGFSTNITNPDFYKALKTEFTGPVQKNPLMNTLPHEIQYNPKRRNAAPAFNPAVESDINESAKQFVSRTIDSNASNLVHNGQVALETPPNHTSEETYSQLFGTLGDNAQFESSMRNFYTMPNSRIPNDQSAFAKFCYGEMSSCKEGNEFACGRINSRLGPVMGA